MTHLELVYYKLYPNAWRITVRDDLTGQYEYLAKNEEDANALLKHLKDYGFKSIETTQLYKEI